MAEFAAAAMAAITTAFSAGAPAAAAGATEVAATAATTAAAAAPAAASAAASALPSFTLPGSFFSSLAQGSGSLLSAMAAVRAGEANAKSLYEQAADAKFDAKSVQIDATNKQDGLRKQLIDNLGARDVAYAASGVDLSFGTPAIARDQAKDDANKALSADQYATDIKVARLQQRSALFQQMAEEGKRGAWIKALGEGLSGMGKIAARG